MSNVDLNKLFDDLTGDRALLLRGDGSALFAIEWRFANPNGDMFARIDAVTAYKDSVSIWAEGHDGELHPSTGVAAIYRLDHPGCSFADVIAHISKMNEGDG